MLVPILVVMMLGFMGTTAYFYWQSLDAQKDPEALDQAEVDALVAEVGELIVLPTDEKPTIATVAEPEKLKNQAFFANAKSGDRVLLYTNAKKAILYDPVAHKIVEVAPINIGEDNQQTPSTTPDTNTEPDVAGATDEQLPTETSTSTP